MNPDDDWRDEAACREHLPLFDLAADRPNSQRASDQKIINDAISVCRPCPVRRECHAYATEPVMTHVGTIPRHEWHGVWAGRNMGADAAKAKAGAA